LTKGVEDLGAVWVTEVRSLGGGAMSIQGTRCTRARIPRIAALFDNATLAKVRSQRNSRESTAGVQFHYLCSAASGKDSKLILDPMTIEQTRSCQ